MLATLIACAALAGAHPDSLSSTRVEIQGREARVTLRFQALSLIEVLPELDPDGDRLFTAEELERNKAAVLGYFAAAWRLSSVSPSGERALVGALERLVPDDPAALGPFDLQRVEARLLFQAEEELAAVTIESRLFHETNPWHKDLVAVVFHGEDPVPHTFEGEETRWTFEPAHVRRPSVFVQFVRLGVDHIRTGFDHQAFLLALLVASRRLRTLIGVVTAFTLAHSLTLAAAALGWVDVPGRFVELAIALSIAYVACDNLLRREPRNPWPEAFFFGLLHGLGFAGFLADALVGEPLLLTALFGFNVGVELGQVALVLLVTAVSALLFRGWRRAPQDPEKPRGLVPAGVRIGVSVLVAGAGFYWFLERAGWWPGA
jgi:hypothetical protein